jgi:hypothetical protein
MLANQTVPYVLSPDSRLPATGKQRRLDANRRAKLTEAGQREERYEQTRDA